MALLDDVKKSLRVTSVAFDTEISDLISAATTELSNVGIKVTLKGTDDPLIKRAITLYCKANFGYDNPESERFNLSYEMLKIHMSMSGDYNDVA